MKKVLRVVGVIAITLLIISATFWFHLRNNMNTILDMDLNTYDFELFDDGEYSGRYYYENQIGAEVNVRIVNGEIASIEIVDHVYGLGQKAEYIVEDIIREQSLDVDAISGATTSSKIIKLAIQDALENGVIE